MAPAVDLSGVLKHLDTAKRELEAAMLELPTHDRMLQAHAYVYGHVRACQVVMDSGLAFLRELEDHIAKTDPKSK